MCVDNWNAFVDIGANIKEGKAKDLFQHYRLDYRMYRAELVVISKKRHTKIDVVFIFVLLSGILYTGSRTVFVLTLLSNIVLIFQMKNKRIRNLTIFGAVLASLGIALYLGAAGKTGVYSVTFIHNDYLQLFLDVGWIPALLFIAAVSRSIFAKGKPFYQRVILCTMALHSLLDFNLQFIGVFMVFLLFMEYDAGREYVLKKTGVLRGICILASLLCIYFGIMLSLARFGRRDVAHRMYPVHTQNEIQLLIKEENIEKADKRADEILSRNEYAMIAYSAKARKAYSDGNFSQVITYKRKIFEKAPFAYEEYEEYAYMLITGIRLYQQAGDSESVQICREELQMVGDRVHNMRRKLSYLGTRIKDQPETQLPEEIERYMKKGGR